MRFYWSYQPRYWEGLRVHGFLNGEVGVRFVHSAWADESELTNAQLMPGTALASMILSERLGLLIDRGCGGIEYRPYAFDEVLLKTFSEQLGDRFLGIQMHEWYSNMVNDLGRVRAAGGTEALQQILQDSPQDLLNNHLEYGQATDYLGREFPATVRAFQGEADHHYQRKASDFFGFVNLTDSYYQSYWWGFKNGARHAMAEIGGQTALTRLQIASVRGAARAYGRGWGVYYEQWACPLSILWHYRDYSFWKIPDSLWNEPFFIHGGRGGSSRALQKRMLYYSLLAGAQSLVEEWGGENTFGDWDTFPLTDYGRIMKEFFQFSQRENVGDPVTKVAIMLDERNGPLDHEFLDGRYETIMRYYKPTPLQSVIKDRFREIFETPEDEARYGEPHTLTAGKLPDVFDIVYTDVPEEALSRYEIVYYLGEDFTNTRDRFGKVSRKWLDGVQARSVAALTQMLRDVLPVWVTGEVAWTINRSDEGLVIGLFNNQGVERNTEMAEQRDPGRDCTVTLHASGEASAHFLGNEAHLLRRSIGDYVITVPAGDCRLVAIPSTES